MHGVATVLFPCKRQPKLGVKGSGGLNNGGDGGILVSAGKQVGQMPQNTRRTAKCRDSGKHGWCAIVASAVQAEEPMTAQGDA